MELNLLLSQGMFHVEWKGFAHHVQRVPVQQGMPGTLFEGHIKQMDRRTSLLNGQPQDDFSFPMIPSGFLRIPFSLLKSGT